MVAVSVRVERDDERLRLTARGLRPLDAVAEGNAAGLRIFLHEADACHSLKARLDEAGANENGGGGDISVIIINDAQEVEIRLPTRYAINPRMVGAIREMPGVDHVEEL